MKLLNAFNIVFLMDNTYKTDKYRLSLLKIIGVTSTWLTFSIAFAFYQMNEKIISQELLKG